MVSATRSRISRGFTLIELLIVIAIIAILALIAIPNFLEAQTRSKVTRVKADLRTMAIAIEAYYLDYNNYPPDRGVHTLKFCSMITTPVAYITSVSNDPFNMDWTWRGFPADQNGSYLLVNYNFNTGWAGPGSGHNWGYDYIRTKDATWERQGCLMASFGPDRKINNLEYYAFLYSHPQVAGYNGSSQPPCNMVYDPSNGTISAGDIGRCLGQLQCPENLGM